jgi:hypothetical protein
MQLTFQELVDVAKRPARLLVVRHCYATGEKADRGHNTGVPPATSRGFARGGGGAFIGLSLGVLALGVMLTSRRSHGECTT